MNENEIFEAIYAALAEDFPIAEFKIMLDLAPAWPAPGSPVITIIDRESGASITLGTLGKPS